MKSQGAALHAPGPRAGTAVGGSTRNYTQTMAELQATGQALDQAIRDAESKGWAVLIDHSRAGLTMRVIQASLRTTDVQLQT